MPKTLLIVEESLKNLRAHWFEYIKTISEVAQAQGYQVDVACHHSAVPEINQQFNSFPVFRYARYLDHQNRLPGDRYYGFLLHSWRCLHVLWPLLSHQPRYDKAFAPTVMVHHLLAWWAIMSFHPNHPQQLTLFFVTNPGIWQADTQQGILPSALNVKLQGWLIKLFGPLVRQGKVTLAVETQGAQREFELLSQLPFALMTHPVPALEIENAAKYPPKPLNFACYGFARYEKGSDLFKAAIEEVLKKHPEWTIRFSIQWTDSFSTPQGVQCNPQTLARHPQVKVIDYPLESEGYKKMLQTVDCMVLPYRNASYYARVSRIAIESAYLGIPMIYTCGGWLEDTVEAFGSGIGIQDESTSDLVMAIEKMASEYTQYRERALANVATARCYFSADNFYQQFAQ